MGATLKWALQIWYDKLTEIQNLLTQSPEEFKDGTIWEIMKALNTTLQAGGVVLLVIFVLIGAIKQTSSIVETKRPETFIKIFVRFIIAKFAVTHGLDWMLDLFNFCQYVINKILSKKGSLAQAGIPDNVQEAIDGANFITGIPIIFIGLLVSIVIFGCSIVLLFVVYGRFFKLYMYAAFSPIPLSTLGGEPTQSMGISFTKSYAAVVFEGAIIALALVIYSAYISAVPVFDVDGIELVLLYSFETLIGIFVLIGVCKGADRIIKEMIGVM